MNDLRFEANLNCGDIITNVLVTNKSGLLLEASSLLPNDSIICVVAQESARSVFSQQATDIIILIIQELR